MALRQGRFGSPANDIAATAAQDFTSAIEMIRGSDWKTHAEGQNAIQVPALFVVALQPA